MTRQLSGCDRLPLVWKTRNIFFNRRVEIEPSLFIQTGYRRRGERFGNAGDAKLRGWAGQDLTLSISEAEPLRPDGFSGDGDADGEAGNLTLRHHRLDMAARLFDGLRVFSRNCGAAGG